jgi:hypothetical protein
MPSVHTIKMGPVNFRAPYFDELLSNPMDPLHVGRLPADINAHGLFYYFVLASQAYKGAKDNLVYEDELSKRFDVTRARRMLESVAFMYGTTPSRLVRFWDAVDAQRRALGFNPNADLPDQFRFRFT